MKMSQDSRKAFVDTLGHRAVQRAAEAIKGSKQPTLIELLELGRSLAEAVEDTERERQLRAELVGYEAAGLEIPQERRVVGFASAFPVRAIGLLDPEEIFLANREKFSQVTLTIGQAVSELEQALEQIQQGGVLALKVAASEVTGEAALTDADTEVFIYILPREIERVVAAARKKALEALAVRIVEGATGESAIRRDEHTDEGELNKKKNENGTADEITHGRSVDLPRTEADPVVD